MTDVPADLLDGLEGDARAARAELLRELLDRGHDVEELRRAHTDGQLLLLPVRRAMLEEGDRTLEEVAAAHGVDPDAVVATRRALGLPIVRGEAVYGAELDEHAAGLAQALAAGVPLEALTTLNVAIGRASSSVALAARSVMRDLLVGRPGDERTRALRAAEAAQSLEPLLERVVDHALREHLRENLRTEVGSSLVSAGDDADLEDVAVGFADLVGFTAFGEHATPAEVGRVAARLEALAVEVSSDGVELVKTLGDGVMLAARDPRRLVAALLALLEAIGDDPELPPVRAGGALGQAVGRAGDWYGGVVNLASRLGSSAPPGTLVVDGALRATLRDDEVCEPLGTTPVRGLTRPVERHLLRPRGRTPA